MAHFAKVLDGVVVQVIVADSDFMSSYVDTSPGRWIQTSYNTVGNTHTLGGTPLRYNFAGIGSHYNDSDDAFYLPNTHKGWILDKSTYTWNAPIAMPDDGNRYEWNDSSESWDSA